MTDTNTAVILAAGTGKRLDIFETNKPLVKLQGISLISWAIDLFKEVGIEKIYVVIRKEDRLIRKELIEFHNNIHLIEQQYSERGMLGSILSIQNTDMETPFFVAPCDLIFDKNPIFLFNGLATSNRISVLISTNETYNALSNAQIKVFYDKGEVDYSNRNKPKNALEVGIYRFTPDSYSIFFKTASSNPDLSSVSEVFQACDCIDPVIMKDIEWFDINTPETLIRADLFLQSKTSPEKKMKPLDATFKTLPVTSSFDYNKKLHFDVHVKEGIINHVNEYEIIPHEFFYSPHHILVDKNLDSLYGDIIYNQFISLGYNIHKHLVDPGEKSKSIYCYAALADKILTMGIEKKSIIISVGGGIIKDLAGFLASTLYRGIGFISFPTTILSQCDAAIALKQGVNGTRGKNLIGSYYSPIKVIVDPSVLMTLDKRYIYDGLSECLKQSFAQDLSFFNFFSEHEGNIFDVRFFEKSILKAIKLKIKSIQQDFYEEGYSLVNQYGHEIGHAVEHLSGYRLLHGESIAIGMRVSAELSRIMGIADRDVVDAHINLLKKYHLPVSIPRNISHEDIINALKYNKKFHGGKARFVLVKNIGKLWHDKSYYSVFCSDTFLKQAIDRSYER